MYTASGCCPQRRGHGRMIWVGCRAAARIVGELAVRIADPQYALVDIDGHEHGPTLEVDRVTDP